MQTSIVARCPPLATPPTTSAVGGIASESQMAIFWDLDRAIDLGRAKPIFPSWQYSRDRRSRWRAIEVAAVEGSRGCCLLHGGYSFGGPVTTGMMSMPSPGKTVMCGWSWKRLAAAVMSMASTIKKPAI